MVGIVTGKVMERSLYESVTFYRTLYGLGSICFLKDLYNRSESAQESFLDCLFAGWLLKMVDRWGSHVAVGSHLVDRLDALF
jgi:hypothetical protein